MGYMSQFAFFRLCVYFIQKGLGKIERGNRQEEKIL